MELRRAERGEAAAVADVWLRSRAASVPAIPAPVHSGSEVRAYFEAVVLATKEVWVAEEKGAVVALLVLEGEWIDQFYVHPDHVGIGLGSALITEAKRQRPGGLKLWTFEKNNRARRFYERHDFVVTAATDGDNEEGEPDVRYEWRPRVIPSFTVMPAEALLPEGLDSLACHADSEGIRIVSTLLERWRDGSERFRAQGEAVLAATAGGETVGIGALSRCPHVESALRVRRFYVAPSWRRQGVARALATELLATGFEHTEVISCNARASAAAAPFWESMGFLPVATEGITHTRRR